MILQRRCNTTAKTTGYLKGKLMFGAFGLIVGIPTLAFALFGWSQAAVHPLFGSYTRYMCGIGGFGAMISGLLMLKAASVKSEPVAQLHKEP
jgi:cytochrome c biogenesis protein CcdA